MNTYRTFTMAHDGNPLVLRADAVHAFISNKGGGTRIYLAGDTEGFVVAEDHVRVYQILESENVA